MGKASGQLVADKDIPIYCDDGFQVGHIKTGATIDITEHGIYQGNSSAYFRFPNPISEVPFNYLYVSMLECDLSGIMTESLEKELAEQANEEVYDPYDEILESVGYNKNKTYTTDEYIEVLTKIFEAMGKENNPDLNLDFQLSLNGQKFDGYNVLMFHINSNFEDHEQTLENTKEFMNFIEAGFDGYGNITEFALSEGTETVKLIVKQVSE